MTGLIDFDEGYWTISDLPGHVSMRFKNMFSGIPFGSVPPYKLRDAPDRAYDIQWFTSRYPIAMTKAAKTHLDASVARYILSQDRLATLMNADYVPRIAQGIKDPESADPHQNRAAELFRSTGRLLLLDDVGLGKTVSALASIADGWGLPAVIVVQPHLADQWQDSINRFTDLTVCQIKKRKPHDLDPHDVYIFRYTNLSGWVDMLPQIKPVTAIFDEIQELRHGGKAEKGRAADALVATVENRIGLTATPIYNYGDEMFTVTEYIAPGSLGTREEFHINWCRNSGTHWIVKDPEALGSYLQEQGITLRRTEDDPEVGQALPQLRRALFQVAWNDGDVETDRDLQRRLAQRILTGSFTERGQAARELDILLRQETGIAKARAVAAYVRNLVVSGEQVILGGWHRAVYDIWTEALSDLRVVMFTGTESQKQKKEARAAILNQQADVIIISLRSGAGLDGLQDCIAHVVFGELDWSPEVHKQLIGRARRRGQIREVTAHYLWTDGGSDPVIMSMLGLKASQANGILNPYKEDIIQVATVDEGRMRTLARDVLGSLERDDRQLFSGDEIEIEDADIEWI
ncbi:SNF2-related protein [Pseudosulfitobacter pseudonitzschiae]|uniref:SNF2-related protein n=1 Tax=Pseudosulfitobacter pseudonitzschiae TaxID=1402135 RepID=UPI003B7B9200